VARAVAAVTLSWVVPARQALWQRLADAPQFVRQSIHDPGRVVLRRGLRAAVLVPLLLAVSSGLHLGASLATFMVFGAMALLVFADFGGTTRSRVQAYLAATLAGIPLIVVGSFAAGSMWTAVAASAIVGFAIAASGVAGGYFRSAQTALLLALILSVTNVASIDDMKLRVVGWAIGGTAAILSGWLLWPRSSHLALRAHAAAVLEALAATVAAQEQAARGPSSSRLEQGEPPTAASPLVATARQELAALRSGFVVAQRRPSGATRRDRALAELATELERALTFASEPGSISSSNAIPEAHELRAALVGALRGSAARLVRSDDVPDIQPLVTARDAHRTALDNWAFEQLNTGAPPAVVLDGLVAAHPLRLMSLVALTIAQNAEIVAGVPTTGQAEHQRRDVWSIVREELTPSSVWLQNSLRTALGLAVAVLVARWLAVAYAFWVVLGTLSALRSNASATGRSAVLALVGTGVGVLVAVPLVGIASGQTAWLWVALPVLVFLAAYTPTAVNFVIGQAAFSMLVVVLFNILAPTDWQIGLVRVEDAALGVGISALVGLLLWPRGARGQLRSALATLYEAAAGSLAASFRTILSAEPEPAAATHAAHDRAHTEVIRAEEVFELFLNERSGQVASVDVWARLLNGGKGILVVGEVLDWMAQHGYSAAGTGAPATTLGSLASEAIANMSRLAEEIRGGRSLRVTVQRDVSTELRSAALASLSEPAVIAARDGLHAAIGLVSTADWLAQLDVLLHDLEAPVAETLADDRRSWWR